MPDITMCQGDECPLKDKCYRHTATPSEFYQSWLALPPFQDTECDMFMSHKNGSHYEGEF